MRIVVPTVSGRVCQHFGHCEALAVVDVDPEIKAISGVQMVKTPPHEPGLLPRMLHELGADVLITGGIGSRARVLLEDYGVTVIAGVSVGTPEQLALSFAEGRLQPGENACTH
ncbi:MAG: NifB/NifX family molybdenum-iron cluster-binding protein [Chthonomonadales bacterium]